MFRMGLRLACCMAAAILLASCGSDLTSASSARVQILLTDAPADYIESAEVWISRVYLMPGAMDDTEEGEGAGDGEGASRVDLFNDPDNPRHYDLLTLRDGVAADLTGLENVPEGSYGKLRLVVDEARVTLKEGFTFRDDTDQKALRVPSGQQSGLKVELAEEIQAEAGTVTVVTVDFDVDQNFRLQGNPDSPAGIQGVLFTPNLKELKRDESES